MRVIQANKDGTYVVKDGYLLPNGLAAIKTERNHSWSITDIDSGAYVMIGLHSIKECREAVSKMSSEILTKLNNVRQSETYKTLCENIRNKANELL